MFYHHITMLFDTHPLFSRWVDVNDETILLLKPRKDPK